MLARTQVPKRRSASDDAESTARGDSRVSNNADADDISFLGLGLAVIGVLSRTVMKIACASRASQPTAGEVARSKRTHSSIPTAREYGPRRPFRARDEWPAGTDLSVSLSGLTGVNNARNKNEVSKQDDTLAQLRQVLDRLLQSVAAGRPLPSRDDGQNTNACCSFGASMRIEGEAQGEALRKALGLV
jgi:hypothetical protein